MQTRILLLGLGFWGRNWLEAISRSPECTLVGVAAAQGDLDELGIDGTTGPRPYVDYREAIDEADADAVIIVVPTALHVDAGRRALEKGLHVLSEKPLASDLAGAEELRAEARRHPGQIYMVSQNYRWRKHSQTMRHAISSGRIGEIGGFLMEFRQPEFLVGDRAGLEMPLIQDMSIHHFDLIRFLLDANAAEVYARSFRPPWSLYAGLPSAEAVIAMDSGLTVGYSGTWAARGRYTLWDGDITVTGSSGCLKLDASGGVRIHADAGPAGDEWSGFEGRVDEGEPLEEITLEREDLDHSLQLLLDSIAAGTTPATDIEDNFHSYAMVAAALESARSRRPVRVAR